MTDLSAENNPANGAAAFILTMHVTRHDLPGALLFDMADSEVIEDTLDQAVKSAKEGVILSGFSDSDYNADDFLDSSGKDDNYYSEEYELTTHAVMSTRDGRTVIGYEETELTGMEGSYTELSFEPEHPCVVSMTRTGTSGAALVFERGKRHISIYEAPLQFELCARTISVGNSVGADGGTITLEYIIELRGVSAQYSMLKLTLTPAKAAL